MANDKLNTAQREAVTYLDGPCLVLAGAGSGKTRVITAKIAHMIRSANIKPQHIAAITFTNKAAKEMADRTKHLLSMTQSSNRGLTISTFHALGMNFLRKEHHLVGLKDNFTIMDSSDSLYLLQTILADDDKLKIRGVYHQISLWKNALLSPEHALKQAIDEDSTYSALAYANYSKQLRAYQAVDFDDLIGLPVQILRDNESVCERWQNKLRYILIDEVQDTNLTQYTLLKYLVGIRAMFTAVGDDDQAIYGWRGATIDNLIQLERDYPQLKLIKLEQNYRSTNTILNAANALISNNPKLHAKQLWSDHGVGDPIQILSAQHEDAESDIVVTKLLAHKFYTQSRFSDYAVLYRSNHQARILEQKLRTEKIPYVLSGGQSFFERSEIKDMLAYLRLIVNDDDDHAFIRAITTPRRGVGPALLETLGKYSTMRSCSFMQAAFEYGFSVQVSEKQYQIIKEFAELIQEFQWRGGLKGKEKIAHSTQSIHSHAYQSSKGESVKELLYALINRIDYESFIKEQFDGQSANKRWKNILDFLEWLSKKAEQENYSLVEVAQSISILSMMDTQENELDAVRLSTLHAAKGLEFRHVYLIGCEEGLLPHYGNESMASINALEALNNLNEQASTENTDSIISEQRLEEERRLMYVGVTRARNTLTVSYCQYRKKQREWELRTPSRFLKELAITNDESDSTAPLIKDTRAHMAGLMARLNRVIEQNSI